MCSIRTEAAELPVRAVPEILRKSGLSVSRMSERVPLAIAWLEFARTFSASVRGDAQVRTEGDVKAVFFRDQRGEAACHKAKLAELWAAGKNRRILVS